MPPGNRDDFDGRGELEWTRLAGAGDNVFYTSFEGFLISDERLYPWKPGPWTCPAGKMFLLVLSDLVPLWATLGDGFMTWPLLLVMNPDSIALGTPLFSLLLLGPAEGVFSSRLCSIAIARVEQIIHQSEGLGPGLAAGQRCDVPDGQVQSRGWNSLFQGFSSPVLLTVSAVPQELPSTPSITAQRRCYSALHRSLMVKLLAWRSCAAQ